MQTTFSNDEINRVYRSLTTAGITLRVDNGQLLARPGHLMSDHVRHLISTYKPGLLALLQGRPVNGFEESLEKGNNELHFPFLEEVYRRAFYNFDSCIRSKSGKTQAQKNGSDVIVYTTSDRFYRIDEKIRYKLYNDIALEHIYNDIKNLPGWMQKDLGIDYLNYAFVTTKRAYLFPWQQLKIVWEKNKQQWLRWAESNTNGFCIVSSPNPTYTTLSCAVPIDLLLEKVKESIIVQI